LIQGINDNEIIAQAVHFSKFEFHEPTADTTWTLDAEPREQARHLLGRITTFWNGDVIPILLFVFLIDQ
jgi:hypothetical protein